MKTRIKLILEDIEINDQPNTTFDVYYDSGEKYGKGWHGVFYAVPKDKSNVLAYRLDRPTDEIIKMYRHEILSYRLGTYNSSDVVSAADVFMYGKFMTQV